MTLSSNSLVAKFASLVCAAEEPAEFTPVANPNHSGPGFSGPR